MHIHTHHDRHHVHTDNKGAVSGVNGLSSVPCTSLPMGIPGLLPDSLG